MVSMMRGEGQSPPGRICQRGEDVDAQMYSTLGLIYYPRHLAMDISNGPVCWYKYQRFAYDDQNPPIPEVNDNFVSKRSES